MRKQGAELHFSPCAAQFDVREHLFDVGDASGEALHLSDAAVYGFQALLNDGIAFRQFAFERFGQLVVHGAAYFVERPLIVFRDIAELFPDRLLHVVESVFRHGAERSDRLIRVVGDAAELGAALTQKRDELVEFFLHRVHACVVSVLRAFRFP